MPSPALVSPATSTGVMVRVPDTDTGLRLACKPRVLVAPQQPTCRACAGTHLARCRTGITHDHAGERPQTASAIRWIYLPSHQRTPHGLGQLTPGGVLPAPCVAMGSSLDGERKELSARKREGEEDDRARERASERQTERERFRNYIIAFTSSCAC